MCVCVFYIYHFPVHLLFSTVWIVAVHNSVLNCSESANLFELSKFNVLSLVIYMIYCIHRCTYTCMILFICLSLNKVFHITFPNTDCFLYWYIGINKLKYYNFDIHFFISALSDSIEERDGGGVTVCTSALGRKGKSSVIYIERWWGCKVKRVYISFSFLACFNFITYVSLVY